MNRVEPIFKITKSMQHLLNVEITNKNREQVIGMLQQKIEEREQMLQDLTQPYSIEEEALGIEVVKLNQQIEMKMNVIFDQIKVELKLMKKKKKFNNSYTNPYQHIQSSDGYFMDNKK
ncbi:flagellar protein FliT [Oceanobacillus iheyensis]|uniref:flagellar protein FliT n=1 Tax=Oceanobacillus iheyensis TaxID=182710 RepID=UPI0036261F9A